ncbi:MAG: hypothetical protein FD137_1676 [Spirochaetes bacterium]|nr:MAG: hypothetical protein FD137_1676 [Spirochaetota bacterium]
MHREILHRNAHRSLDYEVVFVVNPRSAESEVEKKLEGTLDVVDELLAARAHVTQLGDEPGGLAFSGAVAKEYT